MRNKVFAILASAIFLLMLVGAPLTLFLTKQGILPYQNVGNKIVADKTYEEDDPLYGPLTAIETAKVAIKDTYINYLPGFLGITNVFKPLKSDIDRPMIAWLAEIGRKMTPVVCHHVYDEQVIAPTCTAEGYTRYTCRLCGEGGVRDTVAARGHRYGEAGEPIAVGCEYYGYTPTPCLDCREVVLTAFVAPFGHQFEVTGEVPATCHTEGSRTYTCTSCTATLTVAIPVSHTYEAVTVLAPPTLSLARMQTEEPYVLHTCLGCDKSFRTSLEEADGHIHKETAVQVPATCEEAGFTRHTCGVCGDERITDVQLPGGHHYLSEIVHATCTVGGRTHRTCDVCGDERDTDEVAPLGHSYVTTVVPPTAYTEGFDCHECRYCDSVVMDNYVPRLILGIDPPETTPDPEGTVYKASRLSANSMFRIYELSATYPDGTRDTSIVRVVSQDRTALRQNMLEVSELVGAMVEKDPSVNWYFSFATNIEAIPLVNEFFPEESVMHIYEEFLQRLPSSVKTAAIEVNSFKDYANKFYITDHHWNHTGVLEAYYRIFAMLRESYPDIEPISLIDLYMFYDVKFYGSLSRQNASYSFHDPFGLYYYDLPPHELTIDHSIGYGSLAPLEDNLFKYQMGKHETSKGYNHYTEFYRVPSKLTYPGNNTGRRLLLIGDSYSLPLIELVAAHFDETYVRYEDRNWDNLPPDLYYDEFIEEYGITDVLVIEEIVKSTMKGYGTGYPSGFLTIYPDRAWKKED